MKKPDKLFIEFRTRKLNRKIEKLKLKQLNMKRMDLYPANEEKNAKIWKEISKLETKLNKLAGLIAYQILRYKYDFLNNCFIGI